MLLLGVCWETKNETVWKALVADTIRGRCGRLGVPRGHLGSRLGTRWDTISDWLGYQATCKIKVRASFEFDLVGKPIGQPSGRALELFRDPFGRRFGSVYSHDTNGAKDFC